MASENGSNEPSSSALQAAGYVTDKSTCSCDEETFELLDGNITTDDAVRLPCAGVLLQPSLTHECDFQRHDQFSKNFVSALRGICFHDEFQGGCSPERKHSI